MPILLNQTAQTPQTHVLIIGVGGYPHLKDGNQYNPQTASGRYKGLGQLSCPAHSVRALYDAVIDLAADDRWVLPLGSVEVLASDFGGTDVQIGGEVCTRPTQAAIATAFGEWWDRCAVHPQNCAIFYFCGHGLKRAEQFLLAEDFLGVPGAQPLIPCILLLSTTYRLKTQEDGKSTKGMTAPAP